MRHLGGLHGGGGAETAGGVQPASGLVVHVPPGAGRLQAVNLLVLRLDVSCGAGHVEGPGLVGVDAGHAGVHGLHGLKVGSGRVHLTNHRLGQSVLCVRGRDRARVRVVAVVVST